jgi:hypothetical protein
MKLIFHKNHVNRYNLFNQVGLIAISAFGEVLGGSGGGQQQLVPPREN